MTRLSAANLFSMFSRTYDEGPLPLALGRRPIAKGGQLANALRCMLKMRRHVQRNELDNDDNGHDDECNDPEA